MADLSLRLLSSYDITRTIKWISIVFKWRSHRRNELRPGAMKASPRTWYYIDFQRTIDNIKWKMFKIRKQIDDKLRNVSFGQQDPAESKELSGHGILTAS